MKVTYDHMKELEILIFKPPLQIYVFKMYVKFNIYIWAVKTVYCAFFQIFVNQTLVIYQ